MPVDREDRYNDTYALITAKLSCRIHNRVGALGNTGGRSCSASHVRVGYNLDWEGLVDMMTPSSMLRYTDPECAVLVLHSATVMLSIFDNVANRPALVNRMVNLVQLAAQATHCVKGVKCFWCALASSVTEPSLRRRTGDDPLKLDKALDVVNAPASTVGYDTAIVTHRRMSKRTFSGCGGKEQ